jgi:RNA 2',3'-cyclic 3'-phosphodiesterase
MHRLFVAIRPPKPVRDLLIDCMDEGPALRWVSDENLHLTLRFIGEVERPQAEDVARQLQRIGAEPFALRISGTGRFDRRTGGALWAGVEPHAPVAALAAKVERACTAAGLEPERRAFHPHVTLARWGRAEAAAAEAFARRTAGLSSNPWTVTGFSLFESSLSRHGAIYREVAVFPLR